MDLIDQKSLNQADFGPGKYENEVEKHAYLIRRNDVKINL